MSTEKPATAWLEVETKKGTREITRVDMDCTDSPTVRMDQDRYRICDMPFPGDQQDMAGPFNKAIIKAFAFLVLRGRLSPTLLLDAERASGLRIKRYP